MTEDKQKAAPWNGENPHDKIPNARVSNGAESVSTTRSQSLTGFQRIA